MSELGDIHDKINSTSNDVSAIRGMLDGTLPHLATRADLSKEISKHAIGCTGRIAAVRSGAPSSPRIVAALVTAIASLCGVIAWILSTV